MLYPGHEVHMIYQMWGNLPVAMALLRKSAIISLFAEHFEYLNDVAGWDCEGEDPGGEAQCLRREVEMALEAKNFSCLPTHFRVIRDIKTKVLVTNSIKSIFC